MKLPAVLRHQPLIAAKKGATANPLLYNSLLCLVMLFFSCEREWNNPWDTLHTLDPDAWAPASLSLTGSDSFHEVHLEWRPSESSQIEGYGINRKRIGSGHGGWELIATIGNTHQDVVRFTDPSVDLQNSEYEYNIHAFAGANKSGVSNTIHIALPGVNDMEISISPGGTAVHLSARVTASGSHQLLQTGFIWGSHHNLTLESGRHQHNAEVGNTHGPLEMAVHGFQPEQLYYIRAYARSEAGTAYTDVVSLRIH